MQLQVVTATGNRLLAFPGYLLRRPDRDAPEGPASEATFWKQNATVEHACGRIAYQHSTMSSHFLCPDCEENTFVSDKFRQNFYPIETKEEEVFREAS